MKKGIKIGLILICTIVLSACNEDDNNIVAIDDQEFSPSILETMQIEKYAIEQNISIEDSRSRLEIIAKLADVYPNIEEYLSDDFTDVYFGVAENGTFSLNARSARKGELSILDNNFIQTMLKDTGVPINIQLNSALNNSVLKLAMDDMILKAFEENLGASSIHYDPITDSIILDVYDETFDKRRNIESDLGGSEEKYSFLDSYGIEVKLNKLDTPIQVQSVIGGGDLLSGGATECTAGFPATVNDVKGILTAGHCRQVVLDQYRGFSIDNGNYPLGKPTGNKSPDIDIEFYPVLTSAPLLPRFYYGHWNTNTQPINRVATRRDVAVGVPACHYGVTTGYSCGVISGFSTPVYFAGCNAYPNKCSKDSIIKVTSSNTDVRCKGGDSGGPWFMSDITKKETVALGIHSAGAKTLDGITCTTAHVSPLYNVSALGTVVIPTTTSLN